MPSKLQTSPSSVFVVLTAALCLWGVVTSDAADPVLNVRVYDYADVEPNLVRKAQRVAAEVLAKAGVTTAWAQCRTAVSEVHDASCRRPADALVLQMRLHNETQRKALQQGPRDFGYAAASATGLGVVAGVFFDRAKTLSENHRRDLGTVLGHLVAHELGHLLLGANSHARDGLMAAVWRGDHLQRAAMGGLRFDESQGMAMQRQIGLRAVESERTAVTLAAASDRAVDWPPCLRPGD